jgi:peptidoglycan/xylan/chitin deacetylase (PgdA/CDA1 family)
VSRRFASLSLDLDNEWAYLRTRGDAAWKDYPSYLPLVVPRILGVLSSRKLKITVFMVGQDAALDVNREPLRAIADDGHEIANHSMQHEPWLHLYTPEELEAEIESAELSISRVTGRRPVGFRGPGYSMSEALLETLARRGYAYDASTLPSSIGPLARAYYLATGKFSKEQRAQLARLFGSWREGFQPIKPYRWALRDTILVEVPVTTFPLFRFPIHLTYVQYLAGFSTRLAAAYFSSAIAACRVAKVEPSVLLHPLDFLGGDEVPRMQFFPSMKMAAAQKIAVVDRCLDLLQRHFEVTSVGEHARRASLRPNLPIRTVSATRGASP